MPKSPPALFCALAAAVPAAAQITFVDVGPQTGTNLASYGRGAAMIDLDADGLLDLVTANDNMVNRFYRQVPGNTFELANDLWGVALDERSTWAVLAADFDNDGDTDVYFVNGGFPGQPNQLLRNDIAELGVFTDVSDQMGDGEVPIRNFGGATLDYNRDGLLDIFLTTPNSGVCVLLRNDGDLVFTDVSDEAGITQVGSYRHCSMGDINNDGWMDIAVGSFQGENLLYRNNADGTFTNIAPSAGVSTPLLNFGLVLEDFNNDGLMDVFAPKYQYIDPPTGTTELFVNNGDLTFTDVTAGAGLTAQTDMGHNTGDADGDGFPDIFIGTGHPGYKSNDVLLLIQPDGQGGLLANDVSEASGINDSGATRCHGIAFGDYDRDGDVDIYLNNGGPPSSKAQLQENFLWRSDGNANNWTKVRLRGIESNRSAIGARLIATLDSGRKVHRMVRAGNGFGNTDSPTQHIGMLPHETIDAIEILWPSGVTQLIDDPPMKATINVLEDAPGGCKPADVNGSGRVDAGDLNLVLERFGCVGDECGPADIDMDGDIDAVDLDSILVRFGDLCD